MATRFYILFLLPKCYKGIDTIPIYYFKAARGGNMLSILQKEVEIKNIYLHTFTSLRLKPKWEALFDEWFKRFVNPELEEYIKLMHEIVRLRGQIAETRDAVDMLDLKAAENEMKALENSGDKIEDYDEYALVGKFQGEGFLDPKKISTAAYYSAINNMRKAAQKVTRNEVVKEDI